MTSANPTHSPAYRPLADRYNGGSRLALGALVCLLSARSDAEGEPTADDKSAFSARHDGEDGA